MDLLGGDGGALLVPLIGIGVITPNPVPPPTAEPPDSPLPPFQFVGMGAMPLAPVLGGLLLGTLGGRAAVTGLVAVTAVTALIPTLSRTIRSVPRPAEWAGEPDPVTGRPAAA